MDYQSAMSKLRTARSIEAGKPIDNNTRLMKRGTSVAVQLHATDVVTFAANGEITLDSGGWRTVTTKDRINSTSPYSVWSKRGTWFVTVNGIDYVFEDGMTISSTGNVTGAGDADAYKRNEKTRRDASNYAARFVNALYSRRISAPSAGDCMICAGNVRGHRSHIDSHMEENYYVPSLLVNAANEFGASQVMRHDIQALMAPPKKTGTPVDALVDALEYEPTKGLFGGRDSPIAKQIQKSIRRYVLRQLGIAA